MDLPKNQRVTAFNKMHDWWEKGEKARAAAFRREQQAWLAFVRLKRSSISSWWATQDRLTSSVLKALEMTSRPRLAHGIFAPGIADLKGPLVQADQSLTLLPDYIETLLAARSLN